MLRAHEATTGFIVSYRLTMYHNVDVIRIAVIGVNRAQISSFEEIDGIRYCSGRVLRD